MFSLVAHHSLVDHRRAALLSVSKSGSKCEDSVCGNTDIGYELDDGHADENETGRRWRAAFLRKVFYTAVNSIINGSGKSNPNELIGAMLIIEVLGKDDRPQKLIL